VAQRNGRVHDDWRARSSLAQRAFAVEAVANEQGIASAFLERTSRLD